MQQKEKTGFAKTFSIWFDLGALMFGTFCGANMASADHVFYSHVLFLQRWPELCPVL